MSWRLWQGKLIPIYRRIHSYISLSIPFFTLYPSIHQSICLSARPSVHPYAHLSIHSSIHPFIHQSINLSIPVRPYVYTSVLVITFYPSVHPSNYPSIHSSVRPSVLASARPFIHPSVRPSIRPSVRASVRPSIRTWKSSNLCSNVVFLPFNYTDHQINSSVKISFFPENRNSYPKSKQDFSVPLSRNRTQNLEALHWNTHFTLHDSNTYGTFRTKNDSEKGAWKTLWKTENMLVNQHFLHFP